jgi:hypothetical protein
MQVETERTKPYAILLIFAFHIQGALMKRIIFAVVLGVLSPAVAQVSFTPTASTNPKVRAVTGFVRLDRTTYQKQIVDALAVLRRVKAEFESSGYEVQSVRVTTQPLAELVAGMSEDQALTFLG